MYTITAEPRKTLELRYPMIQQYILCVFFNQFLKWVEFGSRSSHLCRKDWTFNFASGFKFLREVFVDFFQIALVNIKVFGVPIKCRKNYMSITLPKTPLLNTWLFIFYDLFYKETESYISEFY